MNTNREYFNDLALLLQSSRGTERERQLNDLRVLGYQLLMDLAESRLAAKGQNFHDLEECVLVAINYFVGKYVPPEGGALAKGLLENSSQAFNLLSEKYRNLYRDVIRGEKTRHNHHDALIDERKIDVRSERYFQMEKERIRLLRDRIHECMHTQSGHLGGPEASSAEFSAKTKQGAFMDYWQNVVTEDNMRERGRKDREWCKTSLPKYRSKPDAENPDGREMTQDEFHEYFRKVCRRIKANVLRAATAKDVDLSLVLPRKRRQPGDNKNKP